MSGLVRLACALALVVSLAPASAFASPILESSASVSAAITLRAVFLRGLTLRPEQPMDFGVLAPLSTSAGTVTISPDGLVTSSVPEIITSAGAQRQPGSFRISGQPNATYAVILQPSASIGAAGQSMQVSAFTYGFGSSAAGGLGRLDASGEQMLFVGATLSIAADQPPGEYSGTYLVTVTYQ
jgi:hypothetical protein